MSIIHSGSSNQGGNSHSQKFIESLGKLERWELLPKTCFVENEAWCVKAITMIVMSSVSSFMGYPP